LVGATIRTGVCEGNGIPGAAVSQLIDFARSLFAV
jgi:hypothetical protein